MSPGFGDEERRRQLAEEIERAEHERSVALLAVAEADARAAQARLNLARTNLGDPAGAAPSPPARVDPLYGVMNQAAASDRVEAADALSKLVPTQSMSQRRVALLERFVEHSGRPSRRAWWIALAFVVGSLAALAALNATTLVDASDEALAKWVEPYIRTPAEAMPTMDAPAILENAAASGVLSVFVGDFLKDIQTNAASPEGWDPAAIWLTSEYRVRPTEHPNVRAQARSLIDNSRTVTALIPSLAQADNVIRTGFEVAEVDSEGLTQDALRSFRSVQSLLIAQYDAQRIAGQAMADLDGFLRTRQGTFTYRLGEYSHRNPEISAQAASLEVGAVEAIQAASTARMLAENTIRDLGILVP